MKNLTRTQRREQVERVLEQVNLTKDAKQRVGGYSAGMKQRLGNPQLLVVDEPSAGLDPGERIRFRNRMARISGQRIVILSNHIVADESRQTLSKQGGYPDHAGVAARDRGSDRGTSSSEAFEASMIYPIVALGCHNILVAVG